MRDETLGFRRGRGGWGEAMLIGAASMMLVLGCDEGGGDEVDAGPPDAGEEVDANVTTPDAGPPEEDAGPPEEDAGPPDAGPPPVTECTTTVDLADNGDFFPLCDTDGPVRHVRIEGVSTAPPHGSAQVVFGFDAAPTVPSPELEADQFKVLLYAGATPFPPPAVQAGYGEITADLGDPAFALAESTVCFDLHNGAADAAPAFAFWVDGENGADCSDRTSLTVDNARAVRAFWNATTGAIDETTPIFYRQSSSATATPTVTLFDEPALDEAAIRDAILCSTTPDGTSDWQAVCEPTAGPARHVRVEDIETTGMNSYWYVVLGEDGTPTGGPPTPAAGKLIVTGGQSASGASWTWFRFGETGTTTQFTYATDAGADLYTGGPSTVCMDVGENGDGNARILFWATGASGADCADPSTLTEANALYDSEADTDTGAIWDAPLNAGATYYRVNMPSSLSAGDITVLSEGAVL